ncbi:group 1 truncated hemoglobin [Chitinophaga sancti]|uniref:group 1 truncated hemoglobin n=1 Tax=Chitinophaga sancti TaxID=1004 RepID=UPI002A75362B|nr:group 1 truncated hemoglobin [Chitinophaga sancti]WPQ61049.1 group 1 truncated hemoglobin [Chitinophaga sancti]
MKSNAALLLLAGIFGTGLFLTSCKKDSDKTETTKTLYDSLGGSTMVNDPANPGTMIQQGRLGIRSVVDSTIFVIAADTAINGFFQALLAEVTAGNTSGFEVLSKNLTDFVCVGTGATSYTYGGKSMTAAHDPAQNSRMNGKAANDDFDAFVADLVKGAKKNGLSDQLIGRVGALVETLRTQVVQK